VNKLLVRNGSEYIKGSTVFAPDININRPVRKEEYERLRKSRAQKLSRIRQRKNDHKKRVVLSILVVFFAGLGLIWNESQVYKTQRQLTRVRREINEVHHLNEALRVELIKVRGIGQLQEAAENDLGMVRPDRSNIVYLDLSKNYFEREPKDGRESKAKDIMARIKNLLF
jgi:cell division protein FtsL